MLVSVIMPTYNCGKFISQSLDSVISQTISDWEVQIVDDCSTDNTAEVLKPYLEKYPNRNLKEGEKVQAKILNTNDNKISLSMKALQEEMVDTEPENAEAIEYSSDEQATTSLGSLLAGLKL